jgi:hypothetical protein
VRLRQVGPHEADLRTPLAGVDFDFIGESAHEAKAVAVCCGSPGHSRFFGHVLLPAAAIDDPHVQRFGLVVVNRGAGNCSLIRSIGAGELGGVRECFVDCQHQVAELLVAELKMMAEPVRKLDPAPRYTVGICRCDAGELRRIIHGFRFCWRECHHRRGLPP